MTPSDAKLFQNACQQYVDQNGTLEQSIQDELEKFSNKLQVVFDEMEAEKNGVFVKMSSRSAKVKENQK